MCITTYRDKSHLAKLANQGVPSIWVGFAEGLPVETYHVYNPKTRKIIAAKDVMFLQKSYRNWSKVEKPIMVPTIYVRSDYEEEPETVPLMN